MGCKTKKKRGGALKRQSIFFSAIYMFLILKKEITRKKSPPQAPIFFCLFPKNCLVHVFNKGCVRSCGRRERHLGLRWANFPFFVYLYVFPHRSPLVEPPLVYS